MYVISQIIGWFDCRPIGSVGFISDFAEMADRRALCRLLSLAVKRRELTRITRGVYVRNLSSEFGTYPPPCADVVRSFAARTKQQIAMTGASAAHSLELTTQVPLATVVLTTGRSRELAVGRQTAYLRHAPRWEIDLDRSVEGVLLKAILWCHPAPLEPILVNARAIAGAASVSAALRLAESLPPAIQKRLASSLV
jgi:hypothetical protein